ncbi:MAG: tetratricopeptide repeat protein [Fuerstiella sp.]
MTNFPRTVLLILLAGAYITAQPLAAQDRNHSRHRSSGGGAGVRQTIAGGSTVSQNWRAPARRQYGSRVLVPGIINQSTASGPPTWSSSRYRVHHQAGPSAGVSRTYSSDPGPIQYSAHGHAVSRRYGSFDPHGPHHHHSHDHRMNHHYGPVLPPFPWNGFVGGYPTIVAPPIVLSPPGFGPTGFGLTPFLPDPNFSAIQSAPPPPATATMPPALENGEPLSHVLPVDEQPVLNEFPSNPVGARNTGAAERIRSLRYQASGDDAFRQADYATAEAFYQTAAKTAPERRAPWLRLAWVQISQQRFPEAASNLKRGLQLPQDATTSWPAAKELYGHRTNSVALLQNDELWKWLEQRPRSTDRLLLTAAFQKLLGKHSLASELTDTAVQLGLPAQFVEVLDRIAEPPPNDAFDPSANAQSNAGTDGRTTRETTEPPSDRPIEPGIRMRGAISLPPVPTPELGQPQPISPEPEPSDAGSETPEPGTAPGDAGDFRLIIP